jgi:RTX calcium-binding nonapeptide repeat (4 copies)/FG-GAP repeat
VKRFRLAGRSLKILLFATTAGGALMLGGPASFAATPSTPYLVQYVDSLSPDPFDRFADRLTAGDANGDGVQDIWAATLEEDINGVDRAGRVQLIDGRTRQITHNITNPDAGQSLVQFGFYISVPGDVNGDGGEDVVVGTAAQNINPTTNQPCPEPPGPEPNGCNERQGRAYVFSGKTGQLIRRLDNPHPQPQGDFGARLGAAGDINNDGRADHLVSAPFNDVRSGTTTSDGCAELSPVPANCRRNQGQVFLISGANGAVLREYNLPIADQTEASCQPGTTPPGGDPLATRTCGNFGYAPQVLGDLTGDGTPDHSIPAGQYKPDANRHGRYYIFNGATGALLSRIDQPVADASSFFGLFDPDRFAPGDLNGDGVPEIYGTGFTQDSPGGLASGGRAWVFDGRQSIQQGTGVVLFELLDPTPHAGEAFGWSMSASDYNKDGTNDLYMGGLQGLNDETYIYNGRNGALLKILGLGADTQPNVTGNAGTSLGYSSRAPGDLNGDCEPDFVASARGQDVGTNQDQGRVAFFLSAGASACPRARPTYPGPSPGPGTDSAAFPGCPAATANVVRGTAIANTITGTALGDRIFAGAGNDRVNALAGNDCVDLGAGTDRGQGGSGRDRVRGGEGADRITGGSGNDNLNGQSGGDRISGSSGNDSIAGSSGSDRISGGGGRDRISAGSGGDRISAGSSSDRISAGSGSDRISARDRRRDRINCGSGRDSVAADRIDRVSRNCERVRRR